MDLAKDGAEDGEAPEEGGGDEGVAADADVEGSIASFIKAVSGIAMAGEDDHLMTTVLESYGRIDDQSFCATNSQIGMKKDYGLFLFFLINTRHVDM